MWPSRAPPLSRAAVARVSKSVSEYMMAASRASFVGKNWMRGSEPSRTSRILGLRTYVCVETEENESKNQRSEETQKMEIDKRREHKKRKKGTGRKESVWEVTLHSAISAGEKRCVFVRRDAFSCMIQ